MFGRNLKVHFAGAEQFAGFEAALYAGVRYQLFTVFPFISDKFGIKGFPTLGVKTQEDKLRILKENIAYEKHTIMDSGLFTLMFGAHAGKRDRRFIERWTHELANFVNANGIKATCVEVDAQKVLGVDEAWEMRRILRKELPNNRIINVFHLEDGAKGLDRLIEWSDYIAVSVPELRLAYGLGKAHEEATIRFANYIKNRKPSIDIHLLGCTSKRLLRECRFCTSSDSTSWNCCNRYFQLEIPGGKKHTDLIKNEKLEGMSRALAERFRRRGITIPSERYFAVLALQCAFLLRIYTECAGDQM